MEAVKMGFSSCPNDTFIFHAMLHGLVDTGEYDFSSYIADVEELNRLAVEKKYPVTKMSFHAWLHLKNDYALLDAGSALGFGCGPLLIAGDTSKELSQMTIAVPGRYTTAFMLLRLWNPELKNFTFVRFDEIMPGIAQGRWDAGLIIHEGRFVFERFKLRQIVDLGEWWEESTGMPIPLGCIALRKDMCDVITPERMSEIIASSILYARENPGESRGYIKSLAQEMEDDVVKQHIDLYVNDFSVSLGETGRRAVEVLEDMAHNKGVL